MDRRFLHEQLDHDLSSVVDKCIAICGCGAIGANLAVSLARRGFNNFILVDHDKIEEHNISTQPWQRYEVGAGKAACLGTLLYQISDAESKMVREQITRVSQLARLVQDAELIVDCFDNHNAREIVHEVGRAYDVLHVGLSGERTGEITWAEHYTPPPDVALDDPCNYPMSRTLIDLTVVAASEAILSFLLRGRKYDTLVRTGRQVTFSYF